MWIDSPIEPSDPLRQGDLLEALVMHQMKLPMTIARPADRDPVPGDMAMYSLDKKKYYLVVSQCCTVENYGVAAIAPIRRAPARTPEAALPYTLETPPADASGPQYAYAAHGIESTKTGHPPMAPASTIYVADFTQIQTYSGDLKGFIQARVARMTPLARKSLRLRLASFWGRAEKEDSEWLEQNGHSPGL